MVMSLVSSRMLGCSIDFKYVLLDGLFGLSLVFGFVNFGWGRFSKPGLAVFIF